MTGRVVLSVPGPEGTSHVTGTAERVLREFGTVVVVGVSRDPGKAAHSVPAEMRAAGFRIIPVNPSVEPGGVLLSEPVHRSLAEVAAAGEPVDVVNVFRPSEQAPAIAEEAVRAGAKVLWLQQGIRSRVARSIAETAGLRYVEDECMAVVRERFGITATGVDPRR